MQCCLMTTSNNYSSFPMAIKTIFFFLVSLLSVLTRVVYAKVPPPAHVSIKAPPPAAAGIAPVMPPVALPAPPPPTPPRNTKECYPLCVERCSLNSRKNICLRACVTCCDRCKCVPKGPYEKREVCGKCYANMTSRGKPKCP